MQEKVEDGGVDAIEYVLWKEYVDFIEEVRFLNPIYPETLDYFFANMDSLTTITNIDNLKTDNVVSMNFTFCQCRSLKELNLLNFKTSNVTSMQELFESCSELTDIKMSSNFDTSNVTNMDSMFMGCEALENFDFLSNFNTSNVTTMEYMFSGCSNAENIDVSNFDTSNVETIRCMFSDCPYLVNMDLTSFNLSSLRSFYDMEALFADSNSIQYVIVNDNFKITLDEEIEDDFYDYTENLLGNGNSGLFVVPINYRGRLMYKQMTVEEFFGYEEFDDDPDNYLSYNDIWY